MVEESVSPLRATYVQHQRSEASTKVSTDSISKPALLREANGKFESYKYVKNTSKSIKCVFFWGIQEHKRTEEDTWTAPSLE